MQTMRPAGEDSAPLSFSPPHLCCHRFTLFTPDRVLATAVLCCYTAVPSGDTWNTVRKELTKVSKLLRLEAVRNLPPKSWAPSRANIEIKRRRSRSRLLILDILPSREFTRRDIDLQYLHIATQLASKLQNSKVWGAGSVATDVFPIQQTTLHPAAVWSSHQVTPAQFSLQPDLLHCYTSAATISRSLAVSASSRDSDRCSAVLSTAM